MTPAQRAIASELGLEAAKKTGVHAEITVMDAAKQISANPSSITVVGQKICAACAARITESGGQMIDDYNAVWR